MAQIKFFNENCFQTMQNFESTKTKVDIILTSPPYSTSHTPTTFSEKAIKGSDRRYDVFIDNMNEDEYCEWTIKLFNEFDKILSENGVILYNISYGNENPNILWRAILSIIEKTNFMIADKIVWKKKSALPNNCSPNKLTRITEDIFVICRKNEFNTFNANKQISQLQKRTGQKFYRIIYNYIEAANNDGVCEYNKATFSSELCLKLLSIYAKPDSVVYDPFMGTGTTALACEKFNPKSDMICYGSELSAAQVSYSVRRIQYYRSCQSVNLFE